MSHLEAVPDHPGGLPVMGELLQAGLASADEAVFRKALVALEAWLASLPPGKRAAVQTRFRMAMAVD